jgi:hypothetical protein
MASKAKAGKLLDIATGAGVAVTAARNFPRIFGVQK